MKYVNEITITRRAVLVLIFILSINSVYAKKEEAFLSLRILYPYSESVTNEFEDSVIKVKFDVSEKFLIMDIYNKTNKRINLEWENFRLDNSAIAFDTDRRIKMDEPKADEVIFPKSNSTHRYIIPKLVIEDTYLKEYWEIAKIKKKGEQFSKIIIPIRVNDSNIDYVFHIGVACEVNGERTKVNIPDRERVDSIKEGMRYEDVISFLGYPAYYTYADKNFTAYYFNGLSIDFVAAYKAHALVLSHYWTPNTINIGLAGRKKTKVVRIDTSKMKDVSPEQYFKELYK